MAETKKTRRRENGTDGAGPAAAGPSAAGPSAAGPSAAGPAVIRDYLKTLPGSPGVYRMIGAKGGVLYVGKAKDLKRRVASYTRPSRLSNRLRRMVSETAAMEVVTTHTEVEALLLESNLIKGLKPRYNVLLRDDKSFPHIFIGGDHEWPQLAKHRGARSRKGDYFGPFASAGAVNETLAILERAFLLRTCSDAVFSSRSRPCLLYQIKRCAAPCVGRIAPEDYAALADEAKEFLRGRSQAIQKQLARRMQEASNALAYEQAAVYRDRIQALTQVQTHQDINVRALGEADVIAAHQAGGQTCIQVFFFRAGRNHGNRAYFPRHDRATEAAEVLGAFLGQFYDSRAAPGIVLISHPVAERKLIEEALSLGAGRRVRVSTPRRGVKRNLIDHALANAREALARRLSESASQRKLLEEVANTFALDATPGRIEVFDNSHIRGSKAVGAMIVAGVEGPDKNAYRKFNIRSTASPDSPGGISPGNDYGMMREVLTRRFTRALKEDPGREKGSWPDLVLIDGGAGHLSTAREALADLGIEDIPVVAIAKGPDRNAGRERFFLTGREPFTLDPRDPVLYYLQRLRDEAHRFAIGGHRRKRSAAIGRSMLDEIEGIGGARKRALLHHFGSARGVARAGLADLETVSGISKAVAKKIYDYFHDNG